MILAWPVAYFALAMMREPDPVATSAAVAAGVGLLVGLLFFVAQLRHVRSAARNAPMWGIFRNGEQVGFIDNASLAEMRLIALRSAENTWGQVGVIVNWMVWVVRSWLARIPCAAFWVVVLTGVVHRESFFQLALAAHPDAFDLQVLTRFGLGTFAVAGVLALWSTVRRGESPPWVSCYRAALNRMLRDHCGTLAAKGRWEVVAEPRLDEEGFLKTVLEPTRG
jgi:hypothetical protein